MAEATAHHGADADVDQSLELLAPRPSWWRAAIACLAVLIALTAVLASPDLLYASVHDEWEDEADGESSVVVDRQQILSSTRIFPRGWRDVGVESIGDVPGARVNTAWVFEGDSAAVQAAVQMTRRSARGFDEAAPGPVAGVAGGELPQRVTVGGDPVQLVILWDLVDCDLLDSAAVPEAVLTTKIGRSVRAPLPEFAGPFWSPTDLRDLDACP